MSLLSRVQTRAPSLPSRVYLYAPEKFGKTSVAAFANNPIFVMTQGETGLLSLLESGQVPETAHFPDDCQTWGDFLNCIRAVLKEQHQYKTLVIDTANGAERLLSRHILERNFNGVQNGKHGYGSYGAGDVACVPEWTDFLSTLDRIRIERGMSIILLAHATVKAVNNPEGEDYDQYRPEGIKTLWPLTHKWADIIACGQYEMTIRNEKAVSTGQRLLRTQGSAAAVAGNRYGLPAVIRGGANAQSLWKALAAEVLKAKKSGARVEQKPQPKPEPEEQPEASAYGPEDIAREKRVLDALHAIDQSWHDPAVIKNIETIIGQPIEDPAIGPRQLSEEHAALVISRCQDRSKKRKSSKTPEQPQQPEPEPENMDSDPVEETNY